MQPVFLVTGGFGFIGSNFVLWLKKHHPDIQVIVVDSLTYAADQHDVSPHGFGIGDIANRGMLQALFTNIQITDIFHFAAESHVTRSEQQGDLFTHTNIEGTKTLLEAANHYKLPGRFIHISTDEVYGPILKGYFSESADYNPISNYAKSKAVADAMVKEFDSLDRVVIRPTNNYGPRQHPEKAIPRWITSAIIKKSIEVWGVGCQIRDWLHVEDTCAAVYTIWEQGEESVYNVGANNEPELTNIDVAHKIADLFETKVLLVDDPRPDHDFRYGVDTERVRSLGWKPSRNFEEGLKDTAEWYWNNQNFWRHKKEAAESIYERK